MIQLNDCFQASPDAFAETLEGQTVILNVRTGFYYSLNPTGSFLWERLDGKTSLSAVAAELAQTYEVDASVTEPDVLELANELASEHLIRKV